MTQRNLNQPRAPSGQAPPGVRFLGGEEESSASSPEPLRPELWAAIVHPQARAALANISSSQEQGESLFLPGRHSIVNAPLLSWPPPKAINGYLRGSAVALRWVGVYSHPYRSRGSFPPVPWCQGVPEPLPPEQAAGQTSSSSGGYLQLLTQRSASSVSCSDNAGGALPSDCALTD